MQPALDMQPEPEVEPGFTVGGPGPVGRAEPRASGTKGSTKIIEVSAWDDMLIAPGSWAHRAGLAPTGGLPAAGTPGPRAGSGRGRWPCWCGWGGGGVT